jgi:hypothetical protein
MHLVYFEVVLFCHVYFTLVFIILISSACRVLLVGRGAECAALRGGAPQAQALLLPWRGRRLRCNQSEYEESIGFYFMLRIC